MTVVRVISLSHIDCSYILMFLHCPLNDQSGTPSKHIDNMNAGKNDKFNCSSYFISHYADCMYSWGSIRGKKQGNQVIGPSNSVFTI